MVAIALLYLVACLLQLGGVAAQAPVNTRLGTVTTVSAEFTETTAVPAYMSCRRRLAPLHLTLCPILPPVPNPNPVEATHPETHDGALAERASLCACACRLV